MTRALFVTGSLAHGGAERQVIALMNRLAERRHECHAVYVKSDAGQLERLRLRGGATVQCLEAARYLDVGALRRFARHLSHIEPSAIVAANPYALMYAALAMRLSRRRVPLIVTFHSTRLLGLKEQLQMAAYRPLFWGAACAVFVCESQSRYWRRRGVFARRNEVIYNGVDTDAFSGARDPGAGARMRAALGFRDTDYVIGVAALLRPEKNLVQLVDALALLRAKGIPAKALLVGDGPMREAILVRARERMVADDVVITGLQHDVRPYVAACDVMTLCSLTEAFSLSALEAMALGKPVVHSEVGGAAEMISPGHNGELFPVGDTGAYVGKLTVLADRAVSGRMGRNARLVVQALFSERTMVDRYDKVLLELCAKPLRPGEASRLTVHTDHRARTGDTGGRHTGVLQHAGMPDYPMLQQRIKVQPSTWLVTGVAGFIGSNLLESLLDLDQRVIGLDNFATGKRDNLAEVEATVGPARWKNFHFIEGDIRAPGDCRSACRGVRYVLHQAALGSVPESIEDPVAYHDSNVTGFLNMLVAARDAGVARFVYAGSSAAYGDDPGLPQIESQTGRPLSPYGLTKYVDELYAQLFARCYGFASIGLRYFNVFGPRQDPHGAYAAVIPLWVASMIQGRPVHINGDGQTTRDFCYVDNVVQANLLAATAEDAAALDQVYNVALGDKTTLDELFEEIRRALEPRYPHLRDARPVYRDFRPGDVRLSQADIGKAARLLGYRPAARLREGLARAIEWYAAGPRAQREPARRVA